MANLTSSVIIAAIRKVDRPAQDEWGMFDPRQAGLEALLRKIQTRSKEADAAYEQSQRDATK